MSYERELEVAMRAAARAGESSMRFGRDGVAAEVKADNSPVTEADRAAERILAAAFEEAFPEDGLLGEEGTAKESRSGRRWIIDPIDGTRDFVRGAPFWAVLIGLEAGNDVVAGVAHFPEISESFHAIRGGGAFRDGTPIHVSAIQDPASAVLCLGGMTSMHQMAFGHDLVNWIAKFWAVRALGGAPDAMMVAQGKAEAWLEPAAKAWDLAPIKVITEEAGGRFFNFDGGSSIHGGNCVTCVPALEPEMRRRVGAPLIG